MMPLPRIFHCDAEHQRQLNRQNHQPLVARAHAVASALGPLRTCSINRRRNLSNNHPPNKNKIPSPINPIDRPSLSIKLEK